MVSFAVQKLLSLIRSHLFIFCFIFIAQGSELKKILLCQSMFCLCFPLIVFKGPGLRIRSLIHFEFICDIESVLSSFIYMKLSSCPSTTY